MPRCEPLARRTHDPSQAGTRGGWGGTPSAARLLDFWIVMCNSFGVFPLNQDRPGRRSTRSAPRSLTHLADSEGEEYLLASPGPPNPLRRRDWMKKIRVGSVCVTLIGAAVFAAAICGQEK